MAEPIDWVEKRQALTSERLAKQIFEGVTEDVKKRNQQLRWNGNGAELHFTVDGSPRNFSVSRVDLPEIFTVRFEPVNDVIHVRKTDGTPVIDGRVTLAPGTGTPMLTITGLKTLVDEWYFRYRALDELFFGSPQP